MQLHELNYHENMQLHEHTHKYSLTITPKLKIFTVLSEGNRRKQGIPTRNRHHPQGVEDQVANQPRHQCLGQQYQKRVVNLQ